MAPQPTPQQPMNLSWDQILPLISMMNNRKGSMNTDISTLFDPQFGFMSGSYNQTSPQDLDSLYAPQTNAIRNSGDANLLGILGAMENGKSAFQIQQSINEKIANGSLPADPDGTGKSYLDLVNTLFAEQNTVKEKMFDQNKIFTNAGLPTPDQQFDPQSYMPEPFRAIDEKVAANRPKVNSALAAIKEKYDMMDKNAKDIVPKSKVGKGNTFDETNSYIDYLNGINPDYVAKTIAGRQQPGNTFDASNSYIDYLNEKNPDYTAKVIAGRQKKSQTKTGAKDSPATKTREQQIRDSNRQLEIERAGGQAKQIISPNSINQQAVFNPYDEAAVAERMKQLIAQGISQGLTQRGETPTNVAIMQRALLNKNSKG
jgi:hypothetical protein